MKKSLVLLLALVCFVSVHAVGLVRSTWNFILFLSPFVLIFALYCFPKKDHTILSNLVVASFSFLFSLILGELAMRSFFMNVVYYRPHEMFIEISTNHPKLLRYQPNQLYLGRALGDLAAMSGEPEWRVLKDIRFRTDSYGYRNEPGAEEVPVQFIALGDSFGVGNGTSQEKIWPVRLEKIRGERVYNLSMSGSPWRELMILKSEINRLPVNRDSIVLWMLFTGNDLEESTCSKQDLETLPKASRWESLRIAYENYRWRSPLRQLILRAFKGNRRLQPGLIQAKPMMNGYPLLFYKPHFIAGSRPREDILTHPHSTCLKETIREMSTFVKERNQKLMVFVIPTKEEVYAWVLQDASPWKVSTVPSGFSEVVEELCREFGIEFYNLKKDFVHYAEKLYEEDGRLLWWPDDTHWNDQGHALVAQLINARLPRTHPE